jgi:hypothetical protein
VGDGVLSLEEEPLTLGRSPGLPLEYSCPTQDVLPWQWKGDLAGMLGMHLPFWSQQSWHSLATVPPVVSLARYR